MNKDLEIEFIQLFVRREKVERLVGFAGNTKTRPKMINAFNTPSIFESTNVTVFEAGERTPSNLLTIFREQGMGKEVYVLSENDQWDGKTMETIDILSQSVGYCSDTIGFCPKGPVKKIV